MALEEDRWDEAAGHHSNVVAGRLHSLKRAVKAARRWRPAMESIGIDVHKVNKQICVVGENAEVRVNATKAAPVVVPCV
jgi:hypothetical protein